MFAIALKSNPGRERVRSFDGVCIGEGVGLESDSSQLKPKLSTRLLSGVVFGDRRKTWMFFAKRYRDVLVRGPETRHRTEDAYPATNTEPDK
jgi:hypothetical protein